MPGMPYWPGRRAAGWVRARALWAGYGMPPAKGSWTVEMPQGRPYHQVARNEAHRWWRPVGSLAVLVVGIGSMLLLMVAA